MAMIEPLQSTDSSASRKTGVTPMMRILHASMSSSARGVSMQQCKEVVLYMVSQATDQAPHNLDFGPSLPA